MKRRKRWAIGLVLAFLAMCVGTWIWSSPPDVPFDFLKGAELRYIRVDSSSGVRICTTSYHVEGQFKAVQDIAARELLGWRRTTGMMDSSEFSEGARHVTVVGYEFGTARHPKTHVLYERPAIASDYPRSFISSVQNWF